MRWFLNGLFFIHFDFFTRYQERSGFIDQSNRITTYSISQQRDQLPLSDYQSAGHATSEKFDHEYTLRSFRDWIEDKFLCYAFAWMSQLCREIKGQFLIGCESIEIDMLIELASIFQIVIFSHDVKYFHRYLWDVLDFKEYHDWLVSLERTFVPVQDLHLLLDL
jgi:hypothetical protein